MKVKLHRIKFLATSTSLGFELPLKILVVCVNAKLILFSLESQMQRR